MQPLHRDVGVYEPYIVREEDIEIAEMPRGSALHGARSRGEPVSLPARPKRPPGCRNWRSSFWAIVPILGRSGDRDTEWLLGPMRENKDAGGYKVQDLQNV